MAVVVETRYGKSRGTVDQNVYCFRGVPYARGATAERRFRPPEPPERWRGIREAFDFAPAPPQGRPILSSLGLDPIPLQSEDCLHLNVWTPRLDGEPHPVLVWIHGGRFLEGSASLPDTNGRRLARRGDAVVITVEYRLGALGFADLSGVEGVSDATPNLGLLDLVAALEWIRDEIDAFGGDPENVTIFGSDTGGTCVASLLAMPRARGLFHRAIIQSAFLEVHDRATAARVCRSFLRGLEPARPSELRTLPVSRILEAQQRCVDVHGSDPERLVFAPVVDGEILPETPLEAVRAGAAAGISLLVGSNFEETRLFGLVDPSFETVDEGQLLDRLEEELSDRSGLAERALALYRKEVHKTGGDPTRLVHAIESDRIFRASACRLAELQSAHQPQTYTYLFRGADDHEALHGVEVPYVFGTLEQHGLQSVVGKSQRTTRLARRIQDAWAAFALTGDPSHRELGRWPRYTGSARATMVLGETCAVQDSINEAALEMWSSHPAIHA